MSVKVLYKTTATATGGRDGTASTADGAFSVKLATPKELGGGGGAGNNPEQLFAAGYAACFIGAMKAVAAPGGRRKGPPGSAVTPTVRHRPACDRSHARARRPLLHANSRRPRRRRDQGRAAGRRRSARLGPSVP